MPFSDPVVAGNILIRDSVRSPNYVPSTNQSPGTGWSINQDGSAEFANVNVRGNSQGDIGGFRQLSASESLLYKGDELGTLLNNNGAGILTRAFLPTGAYTSAAGVGKELLELRWILRPTRTYRVAFDELLLASPTVNTSVLAVLKYTVDSTTPTVTNGIELGVHEHKISVANGAESMVGSFIFQNGNSTVDFRIVLYMIAFGGVVNAGTRNTDMWIEDLGPNVQDTGFQRYTGSVASKTYKTFEVGALAFRSYYGNGNYDRSDFCFQGSPDGSTGIPGNRVGWSWFDMTLISDLNGVLSSDLVYLDAYLFYPHWYASSGGICVLGWHNNTAIAPQSGTEPAGGTANQLQTAYPGRNVGKWMSLFGTTIGNALLAGTWRGFLTGRGPNLSTNYYGFANTIRIRAGYYK